MENTTFSQITITAGNSTRSTSIAATRKFVGSHLPLTVSIDLGRTNDGPARLTIVCSGGDCVITGERSDIAMMVRKWRNLNGCRLEINGVYYGSVSYFNRHLAKIV